MRTKINGLKKTGGFMNSSIRNRIVALGVVFFSGIVLHAQPVADKQTSVTTSLNGNWNVIIDPTDIGEWRQVWLEQTPKNKTDFFEYSFDGGPTLPVPGDFNSKRCELKFFEGTVWYRRQFSFHPQKDKRLFIRFEAVNYRANVYVNGKKIGSHEGGFTPFQFEITADIHDGQNTVVVKVNNSRSANGLPGMGYDWLNYGGITRDVSLVETGNTFIDDYTVQLKKDAPNIVMATLQLNGAMKEQNIEIKIPELKISHRGRTDANGSATLEFKGAVERWTPQQPKRYQVILKSETDVIIDTIGFRNISIEGNNVLLNGKSIFFKAVNIHEEQPMKAARAYSKEDALVLLQAAKDLGCNLVRLAHYPHNAHMVKEAEKMGLMVWSELPVYQHIQFSDSVVPQKMERMLTEMIRRDKNRCGIVVWCLSNETYPSTPNRTNALIELTKKCRELDSSRLIVHVTNSQQYEGNTFKISDPLYQFSDIVALNEYIGWYIPWQGKPTDTKWSIAIPNKPVFISEFGAEALYGNNDLPGDIAGNWTETYQAQVYKNQIEMFKTVPNLCGVSAWLLFDYQSPGRMHPTFQHGYNRKGLISEKGEKKKAWYSMRDYFTNMK